MPESEQDIAWLLHNQASLNRRLERVEASVLFRMLRAVGRRANWLVPNDGMNTNYAAWRKRGGGMLPLPANCVNSAIEFAEEYMVFAPDPAAMHPSALAHLASAAPADFIYCDEEILSPEGTPLQPLFRPDWSPTLERSTNYPGNLVAVRKALLSGQPAIHPSPSSFRNATVVHVPAILYSSRGATVSAPEPTQAPAAGSSLVSIIICTRTARLLESCLAGIRARTDYPKLELIVVQHLGSSSLSEEDAVQQTIGNFGAMRVPYPGPFHFADMNNRGAAAASGQILLFLNDDVDPLKPDWLRRLTHWLANPAIGAAGAKLTFPDGALQHAGIAAYLTEGAWHAGRSVPPSPLWPWNAHTREVSAVTGACLAIRTADFHRYGCFNPDFPVNFNDVDLCFRLQAEGLSIIFDSEAELRHAESRTRQAGSSYEERRLFFRKWSQRLEHPDPFYSPHLAPNTEEFRLR